MKSCKEFGPSSLDALGDMGGHDALANRERAGVAYKGLHSNAPQALDLFAALNVAIQDEFAGRVKGICLEAGLSEKQYRHVNEGLNGDGYPAVMMALLWNAAPKSFAAVLDRVLKPMGYEVHKRVDIKPVETAHESAANLAERAGSLQGVVVRALSDGRFDPTEARDVVRAAESLRSAADSMEAHARAIGVKR